MLDTIKKLFARSNIKDAEPTQTRKIVFPASSVSFHGSQSSCMDVQKHFDAFLRSATGNKLYVGQIEKIYPDCRLMLYDHNCGQVHSIGLAYGSNDITIATSSGRFTISR